jgi:hypothetical protein
MLATTRSHLSSFHLYRQSIICEIPSNLNTTGPPVLRATDIAELSQLTVWYIDDVVTFTTPLTLTTPLMEHATAGFTSLPPALWALTWEYLLPSAKQRLIYDELITYVRENSLPELVDVETC